MIHKVYMSCFTSITVTVCLFFNWTVQSFGKVDTKISVCCKSYFIHAVAKEHFFGCLLKFPSFSWHEGLLQRVTDRMAEVGRDLWKSSHPSFRQGQPEPRAQDHGQMGFQPGSYSDSFFIKFGQFPLKYLRNTNTFLAGVFKLRRNRRDWCETHF